MITGRKVKNMGFFQRLKEGLKKTSASIANVFRATEITDEFYDELEKTDLTKLFIQHLKEKKDDAEL